MCGLNVCSISRKTWCIAFLPLVVARPVPSRRNQSHEETYIPLLVVLLCLFLLLFVLLAVKFLYMKLRRIKTIHRPASLAFPVELQSSASLSSHRSTLRASNAKKKEGHSFEGLLLGCLGSPSWETNIKANVDEQTRRQRESFNTYQPRRESSIHWSRTLHMSPRRAPRSSALGTDTASYFGNIRGNASASASMQDSSRVYGDEDTRNSINSLARACTASCDIHSLRDRASIASIDRAMSTCPGHASIRLVSSPRENASYNFLSEGPPEILLSSPLMGTRDSILLSKSHFESERSPALPLLPLPAEVFPSLGQCPDSTPTPIRTKLPVLPHSPSRVVQLPLQSEQRKSEHETAIPHVHGDVPRPPSWGRESFLPLAHSKLCNPTVPSRSIPNEVLVNATEKMNRRRKSRGSRSRHSRAGVSPLHSSLTLGNTEPSPPLSMTTIHDKENDPPAFEMLPLTTGGAAVLHRAKYQNAHFHATTGLGVRLVGEPDNTQIKGGVPMRMLTSEHLEGIDTEFPGIRLSAGNGEMAGMHDLSNAVDDGVAPASIWEEKDGRQYGKPTRAEIGIAH